MALPLILGLVGKVVDSVTSHISDKSDREKAKINIQAEIMKSIANTNRGQVEINKIEAAHKSLFVAGWRPFIGWSLGLGIFWIYIGKPIVVSLFLAFNKDPTLIPDVPMEGLYAMVTAMLGLGGIRGLEKIFNVARNK